MGPPRPQYRGLPAATSAGVDGAGLVVRAREDPRHQPGRVPARRHRPSRRCAAAQRGVLWGPALLRQPGFDGDWMRKLFAASGIEPAFDLQLRDALTPIRTALEIGRA